MAEEGFPVPRFCRYDIDSMAKAIAFMQEMGKPVVIKPGGGGGGRGVTMFVQTAADLRKATYHASVFGTHFIAEEQVAGGSFRLLYLGGRFIDAIRRDPPLIRGNGRDTIARLIKITNQERLVNKPVTALSPLTVNYAMTEQLKRLDLTLDSVPAKDEMVVVNSVVNQNAASENHIVRDQVHPDIIELGKRIVSFLGIELAGLDIIALNLSEPLEKTAGIINEINTTPGLHHHDLVAESDKKINVGKIILDYIFDQQHS
jgi:D-alanine-D-alanine ligase-like ATP-grasp enzyme